MVESVSLVRFLSSAANCSRNEAEKFIREGRVKLNGKTAEAGMRVNPGDKVLFDGEPLQDSQKSVIIAFNKPPGIHVTNDQKKKNNIIDFIGHEERLFPIGQMDRDAMGLVLLTNRGDWSKKILEQMKNADSEYIVSLNKPIDRQLLYKIGKSKQAIQAGLKLFPAGKFGFRAVASNAFFKNLWRLLKPHNYRIRELYRTRIAGVRIDKLKPGKWRKLNELEKKALNIS